MAAHRSDELLEIDMNREHRARRCLRGLNGSIGDPQRAKIRSATHASSKLAKQRSRLRVALSVGTVVPLVLPLPSPGGPGRLGAARGRAVALRVEPLSKAQRLAPDGLPSLTQHGQAGDAG